MYTYSTNLGQERINQLQEVVDGLLKTAKDSTSSEEVNTLSRAA
jgi:hypothetical protein